MDYMLCKTNLWVTSWMFECQKSEYLAFFTCSSVSVLSVVNLFITPYFQERMLIANANRHIARPSSSETKIFFCTSACCSVYIGEKRLLRNIKHSTHYSAHSILNFVVLPIWVTPECPVISARATERQPAPKIWIQEHALTLFSGSRLLM